jgi:hypothetical protein
MSIFAVKQMVYSVMDGWWTDAGTLESLRVANELATADPSDF